MKKRKIRRLARKALSMLLCFCAVISLAEAAMPTALAALEELRAADISDTTSTVLWDGTTTVELSQEAKDRIAEINLQTDYAPRHYVAYRRAANSTEYFPEKDDLKGFKVGGSTSELTWYYRSMRWWYFSENDTVYPLFSYAETESRVDHYWHGSWKKYPERTDDCNTAILWDNDAWFECQSASNTTSLLVKSKKDTQGVDDGEGVKYNTGFLTAPFRVYLTIPAFTTYTITLNFKMEETVAAGEYSYAVMNGYCNKGLAQTDVSPSASANIADNSQALKYGHFEDSSDAILAYDYTPDDKVGQKHSKNDSVELTLENNTSQDVTFLRCYYLIISHAPDATHQSDTNLNAKFDGKLTVSISNLKYKMETTDISEDVLENGGETVGYDFTVACSDSSSDTAAGNSYDYGVYSQNTGKTYLGYYSNEYTVSLTKAFYLNNDCVEKTDQNTIRLETPGTLSDSKNFQMVVVPVSISYTVPAGKKVQVQYAFESEPYSSGGGEYCFGVLNGTANSLLSETDANILEYEGLERKTKTLSNNSSSWTIEDLSGVKSDVFYEKNSVLSIKGQGSTNLIAYRNDVITEALEGFSLEFPQFFYYARQRSKAQYESLKVSYLEQLYLAHSQSGMTTSTRQIYNAYNLTIQKVLSFIRQESQKKGKAQSLSTTVDLTFDNRDSTEDRVFTRYYVYYLITEEFTRYEGDTENLRGDLSGDQPCIVEMSATLASETLFSEEDTKAETAYLTWETDTNTWNLLRDNMITSDKDVTSGQGWSRLVMQLGSTTKRKDAEDGAALNVLFNRTTVTGLVSDEGFTAVQQYYTHPLGDYLKYAWLYNGTVSQPGAMGYDYARPACAIKLQALQSTATSIEYGTVNKTTYQSWYIKYAGSDSEANPQYYLAMEGTDGKRHLLCRTVTCVGDGKLQDTICFVTLQEYKQHPELYQTAYAWPITETAAKSLNASCLPRHTYKGFWQKTADDGEILIEENLKDEAFRVSVTGSLLWSPVIKTIEKGEELIVVDGMEMYVDGMTKYEFYGFMNRMTPSAINAQDSSLYAYYLKYKNTNGTDGSLIKSYQTQINNCLTALKNIPAAYVGIASNLQNGSLDFSKDIYFTLVEDGKQFSMDLALGEYQDDVPENTVTVKNGQIYVVTSANQLKQGYKMVIEKGGTLQINGTLVNNGTLECYGTVIVEDGGCLRDPTRDATGTYNFVGGTLIISTNGVFRQSYNCGKESVIFSANSTIYNDGLLLLPRGMTMKSSELNNGVNGVVMCGCTLRRDSELTSASDLVKSMPRGMPDYDTMYELMTTILLVYGRRSPEITGYEDSWYHYNSIRLHGASVVRNNGALYDIGGVLCASSDVGKNVILGSNPFIHYGDIVVGHRTNSDGVLVAYDNKADANQYNLLAKWGTSHWTTSAGDWYNESANVDYFDANSTYVNFSVQSVTEVLEANLIDFDKWKAAYCKQGAYNPPDTGGC